MIVQEAAPQPASWAIVTPSYSGDYQRCLLLCNSIDAFVTGPWHHYVIVDRPDFGLFKHLNSACRSILITDEVLPGKRRRLLEIPFLKGRSLWWSAETGFSIGWHMQQMVKIAMAEVATQDGLMYCDSDVFFVRPLQVASLSHGPQFRLYRVAERSDLATISNPGFVKSCLALLGLPQSGQYFAYIDNIVTWRRQTVLNMCDYLAAKHKGKWTRAFRNRLQISEYNLYGLFADEIERDDAYHFGSSQSLCKTLWSNPKQDKFDIEAFCNGLAAGQVAIGIQSFVGFDLEALNKVFAEALQHHRLVK